jgi:glucosamine-6-phosphate deaminase
MASMRIEIVRDEAAVAARAADIICDAAAATPQPAIALPTGTTPLATYAQLNRRAAAGECNFSRATIYAIDEFCGVDRETPGSNGAFYARHLQLSPLELRCPDPAVPDPAAHIRAYAESIQRKGGLDICVLGIGTNGHIAFNEPGSARDSGARVVTLEQSSRAAHAASFGSLEAVPDYGMTLGVADLLAARAIVVLATGSHKAAAVRAAIEDAPDARVPASWLQRHGAVTWLLDRAAASMLHRRYAAS